MKDEFSDSSFCILHSAFKFNGPNFRTSSTNAVVSAAKRAPSAALAQTSFTRSGSMPRPQVHA